MSRILLITSSPRGAASYSSRVARALADKLAAGDGRAVITVRDLAREPLPHIDESFAVARNTPPERLSAAQRAALERSDALVRELQAAEVVIIAAAMINFGIPSTLKAWIDHVLRPGVTFRYGENGPEGLVRGKKVYLVLARGGVYSGPMQALNFQDTYLKAALGFIGLTDVTVLAVEGVALGEEAAVRALGAALEKISALAA
jgi:FMN-dependent NADH-azoreductase